MNEWRPMSEKPAPGSECELKLYDGFGGMFMSQGRFVLEGEHWYRVDVEPRLKLEAWPMKWRAL